MNERFLKEQCGLIESIRSREGKDNKVSLTFRGIKAAWYVVSNIVYATSEKHHPITFSSLSLCHDLIFGVAGLDFSTMKTKEIHYEVQVA